MDISEGTYIPGISFDCTALACVVSVASRSAATVSAGRPGAADCRGALGGGEWLSWALGRASRTHDAAHWSFDDDVEPVFTGGFARLVKCLARASLFDGGSDFLIGEELGFRNDCTQCDE